MSLLRAPLVAGLSAPMPHHPGVAAVVHGGDVVEWSPPFVPVSFLMHLRGERIAAWAFVKGTASAEECAEFLRAVPESVLDGLSPSMPVVRVDQPLFREFSSYAALHPSVELWNPSPHTQTLLRDRVYLVFPCHRCEVASTMDAAWFKSHALPYSKLARPPHAAAKIARLNDPSQPTPRTPAKPPHGNLAKSIETRDVLEIENFEGRVLTLRAGRASLGEHERAVNGISDATALLTSFLERDAWLDDALPVDELKAGALWERLKARSGNVVDDVEPVFFEERATKRLVARAWVRLDGTVLHVEVERLDDRITEALLPELINGPYLFALTRHHWRGRAARVALSWRGESTHVTEYPYPAR